MKRLVEPEGDYYPTSDQMMCEVLLMAGHQAVSVLPGDDGHLVYSFVKEEVWPVVVGILTGQASDMEFRYSDWWRARITWQMNLRHRGGARMPRREA